MGTFAKRDERWKESKFVDLPTEVVKFAKLLDLKYDAGTRALRQRDDEPVAWLEKEGFVELWTVYGIVTRPIAFLETMTEPRALILFQTSQSLENSPNQLDRVVTLLEETKRRLDEGDALAALRFSGTVGKEDILEQDGRTLADMPVQVSPEEWDRIHARAQAEFDSNPNLYLGALGSANLPAKSNFKKSRS